MAYRDGDTDSFRTRAGRTLTRAVVTLVVLALVGAVLFFMSQLNARTFSLEIIDGKLTVMKGRMLPVGSEPWHPADPVSAEAYGPLELEGTAPTQVTGQKFGDRDELDRALFDVIAGLAKSRVVSDDPRTLESGLYYLRRADKLGGITKDQSEELRGMKAEVSFYQARTKLEEAQRLVTEAMAQLKLAATSGNRHARAANQMISAVEPPAKSLEEALRAAINTLSSPADAAGGSGGPLLNAPLPTPAPAPAPAAPAPAPVTPAPAPAAAPPSATP